MDQEQNQDQQQERIFKLQRITIILLFGVFAAICILVWQNYLANKNNTETTTESSKTVTPEVKVTDDSASVATTKDEFADWKTYTNNDIGYKLKYPADWVVKEIDTKSEITDKDVKYITVTTPDKKYFLHFGLAPKGATFDTTDRSGIGAGDIVKGDNITILNTTFKAEKLVYKSKEKEYFYPQSTKTTTDSKWIFTASFSATDKVDYNTLDMSNLAERTSAEKILSTIQIIEK